MTKKDEQFEAFEFAYKVKRKSSNPPWLCHFCVSNFDDYNFMLCVF